MRDQPYSYQGVFAVFDSAGVEVGRLSSGVYTDVRDVAGRRYRDTVRIENGSVTLYRGGSDPVGVVQGLLLVMNDGEVLTLVPRSEEPRSGTVRRLDDPDAFRVALEFLQLASECGQAVRDEEALKRRIENAAFYRCPTCRNEPSLWLGCPLCGGDGFVGEGVA